MPVVAPGTHQPLGSGHLSLVPANGPSTRSWALASGSGGVGRSTLSLVLGARLAYRGRSACLVDADWTGPLLASMLDVQTSAAGGPWSREGLSPEPSPGIEDLHLVPGANPLQRSPSRKVARNLLLRAKSLPHSEVILDLPAGSSDVALDLWLGADCPIVVALPERLPLEATSRLLARVFARLISPWLNRRVGAADARRLLDLSWDRCAGRTGTWMRALAREGKLSTDDLCAQASRRPLHLLLNRVRRGDDVDVGHALSTAAGHGLGLDLRFQGVVPFDEVDWIRSRRYRPGLSYPSSDLIEPEVDDFLDRVAREMTVPERGDWNLCLDGVTGASVQG